MTKDGESTMQKVKDVLHIGNKDHSTTSTTGTTHTGTTHNTTTGTHIPGTSTHAEGAHGPHKSAAANAADPRVDSDLDGNRLPNKTSAGYGTQDTAYGSTGTHTGSHLPGTTGTHTGAHTGTAGSHIPGTSGTHTGTTGSHIPGTTGTHTGTTGSHISGTTGTYTGTHTGTTGTTGTGTHIPGTTHNQSAGHAEGTHGPHSSSAMNALDPRVDSDMDGNRVPNKTSAGYGTQDAYGTGIGSTGTYGSTGTHHTGTTGGISHSTNAGPHNSNLANAADPRVDSDLSSTGNRHGATGHGAFPISGSHATPGSGTAQNTAGPHNSDMMNKMDPRVDADLDGSKTYGGNKTHY